MYTHICRGRPLVQKPDLLPSALAWSRGSGTANNSCRSIIRSRYCEYSRSSPSNASQHLLRRRPSTLSPLLHRRGLSSGAFLGVITPPAVFLGLVIVLWAYKCLMLVIFQNKIIYMPSIPPFSRKEKISDYDQACLPIKWQQVMIKSLDDTSIALCVSQSKGLTQTSKPHAVVLYFQGNASSLPPRLPMLSKIVAATNGGDCPVSLTVVAVSYRGFWQSRGRPSQRGIQNDAQAALAWTESLATSFGAGTRLFLWGQSIGAGVAAWTLSNRPSASRIIDGMILETPFISVKDMLIALYPQKWLPYRYLWPFLRNRWDTGEALRSLSTAANTPPILILSAAKDEVVPPEHAQSLAQMCKTWSLPVDFRSVQGALHHEATTKHEGRKAISDFIRTGTAGHRSSGAPSPHHSLR